MLYLLFDNLLAVSFAYRNNHIVKMIIVHKAPDFVKHFNYTLILFLPRGGIPAWEVHLLKERIQTMSIIQNITRAAMSFEVVS